MPPPPSFPVPTNEKWAGFVNLELTYRWYPTQKAISETLHFALSCKPTAHFALSCKPFRRSTLAEVANEQDPFGSLIC